MEYAVINVGAFVGKDARTALTSAAKVRAAALEKCYSIAGYDALPLDEKNAVYDSIRREIEASI